MTLRWHPLVVLGIALVALPFAMRAIGMTESLATEIALFALVGLAFNLLLGYTGLLSFGHGLFFGFAAYAAALSQIHWFPGSLVWPIAFGVAATALLGLVVGFFALRRRGVYFSLLTLAFTALAFFIAFRWTEFTGGESGLRGIARPVIAGVALDNQFVFYALTAVAVFAAAWVLLRIVRSPFGSVLEAIRENEQRSTFAGYPVRHYKLIAFVVSATATGLAGCLFAFLKSIVSADTVHVSFSGEIVAMTIIGGTRTFLGPALGALFYILFRELLSGHTDAWMFWFGLLFMAFILYSPAGLAGLGTRLWAHYRKLRGWFDAEAAAMAARVMPPSGQSVPSFLQQAPRNEGTAILACENVVKRFGAFIAVNGATLRIADRRLHALIGPNGAGKTTLFNVISGLHPAEGGTIALAGARIDALSADRVAARGLSRSFQITNLFPTLSVRENLRLGCQARDRGRRAMWRPVASLANVNAEAQSLIRFLGLEGLENVPVSSLSYGGQRLVEIGIPLAAQPRVLLLDEPLVGLAAAERERITLLIKSLAPHMAVLLVEHDMDRVFTLADRITAMNEGRVIAEGTPEEVRNHAEVQRVYLGSGAARKDVAARGHAAAIAGADLLRVEAINAFYGKSHVLHDVSFAVREREVLALLGRNGAGKTSTFKSIMGIVQAASGTVSLATAGGVLRIEGRAPEAVARLGLGLVPQGRRLFSGLTVAENLALGGLHHRSGTVGGVHWVLERIFEVFPRIRDRMHVRADRLSGGEQQMVAIARALSGNVRLLLLDEPFEGLAPAMVDEVFRAIEQLRHEISILIIEHHLDLVLSLADRAVVLDRGHVSHEGPSAPLLHDLDFRKKVLWV